MKLYPIDIDGQSPSVCKFRDMKGKRQIKPSNTCDALPSFRDSELIPLGRNENNTEIPY